MPLVEYASSSSSSEDDDADDDQPPRDIFTNEATSQITAGGQTPMPPVKRKREAEAPSLPPLPSHFHDLYASTAKVSVGDHPDLHGGRERVTPHVEGNWPTHVYVEWYPIKTEYDLLQAMIATFQKKAFVATHASRDAKIQSLLSSELGAPLPLHISLSRPVGFLTDAKDAFAASLRQSIDRSGIRPFFVKPTKLDWVSNLEKSRWFLVLRILEPRDDDLNRLLSTCNSVVESHGQPPLYESPQQHTSSTRSIRASDTPRGAKRRVADCSDAFHVSVAWSVDEPGPALKEMAGSFFAEVHDLSSVLGMEIRVDEVKAKIGNAVMSMPLPSKVAEIKTFFG